MNDLWTGPPGRSLACVLAMAIACGVALSAQAPGPRPQAVVVLRADRVFDGERMQSGWVVVLRGDRIEAAGPAGTTPAGARTITLPAGTTLLPGLIEGHSHLLLHPYNETSWNDQVL